MLVTYGNYAWIAYHAGNVDQVERYLQKMRAILKGHPKRACKLPTICGERGWTFLRLGLSIFLAKESFEEALKREPQSVSFNVGYAVVLYRLDVRLKGKVQGEEETSKVTSQLRKALVLEPGNVEVMALLALKLQSQDKDRQEAMALVKQVLSLSPDSLLVTNHLTKFFKMEGSIKESLDVLRTALEVTPTSFFLHYQTGLCHQWLLFQMLEKRRQRARMEQVASESMLDTETAESIHHFSRAVELQPSNISARVKLAETYGQNLQMEEATKIFMSLKKDQSLGEFERQHVLCSYGCFLMYQIRSRSAAVTQLKAAYQIPVHTGEKHRAERKLRLIAEWWSTQHSKEANEILTFLHDQDKQEQERQREEDNEEKSRVEQRSMKESRRQKREIQKEKKKERKKQKVAMNKEKENQRKEDKQMLQEKISDGLATIFEF
ncbi:interferon-induced protein with tetratricopeptide repeats 5-like [Hypomesus transpacificus]|uniref:interferon-induced protein with tetratricopeptide repeats 5-like n=1 Tax=Hypomesus transpacificus TaxID=137520 RepID=UPI001F084BD3|nr:interferon-induced protein with tetratricopeptide repeats 5-like [Hypomesus transpacificus]